MAHHKRKKSRRQRAGCGLCKPHKKWARNGEKAQTRQELKARASEEAQFQDFADEFEELAYAKGLGWRKRYAIEHRADPDIVAHYSGWPFQVEWAVVRRYWTAKQRDQALAVLESEELRQAGDRFWEYRPVDR